MENLKEELHWQFAALGIEIPEILLPRQGLDLQKWAVIACDQFTQDCGYWEKVKTAAAGAPSTLNLIFPEAYLTGRDKTQRITDIHHTMERYLAGGIFAPPRRGCVYVERDTPFQQKRRGLVAAVDLEQYDWTPQARTLIRSTEGTVPERLPPRMDIRRGAALETPHILLLIDDDADAVLPGLAERAQKNAPVYQTPLMFDSGGVKGWFIEAEADLIFLAEKLEALARRAVTRYLSGSEITPNKVESGGAAPFLFAAGDGNHSLAAAKGIWEEYKQAHGVSGGGLPVHPCRYALVEIENIYDRAIKFEPIHRVLFGMSVDNALGLLAELPGFTCRAVSGREELVRLVSEPCAGSRFGIAGGSRYALVETSAGGIATAALQPLLDRRSLDIDYIHGEEELFRLAAGVERRAVGILLPPLQKAGLFETAARSGPLPRKSFSMGESCEKRFYLECRKLFG